MKGLGSLERLRERCQQGGQTEEGEEADWLGACYNPPGADDDSRDGGGAKKATTVKDGSGVRPSAQPVSV